MRNNKEWGPDIRRASLDEEWVVAELQKRTPSSWRWIKNPRRIGFDLLCVRDMFDITDPVGQVEVEGTPKYKGRQDTWPAGYRFPPAWRMGITIPRRKLDDYILPWVLTPHRGEEYYLKCNHTHTEIIGLKAATFLHGHEVTTPDKATPKRLRQHDLMRRNLMISVPVDVAKFGIPYVFDWLIDDLFSQYLGKQEK